MPKKRIVLYSPLLADPVSERPTGKHVLPLSLLTIAAGPERDGFEVLVIDGSLYGQEEAHRRVLEACEGALLYGTTGILGYQVADSFLCTSKVRARHPGLTTVIGGWFASVTPELQLSTGLYDAVALGQGEITFRELVQAVAAGEPFDGVAGLALPRDGGILLTEHRAIVGWDRLERCAWHLIDFDEYRSLQLQRGNTRQVENLPRPPSRPRPAPYVGISYYASFGCPEPCAFCCSPGFSRRRWKAMPAERMLDDIEELRERWDFDVVRFHDANFGVSESRVRSFADGLLERELDLAWFPMAQSSSLLSYERSTVERMAASGMYVVNVGAEAGTEEMLEIIGKSRVPDGNYEAAELLDELGVMAWMTYIIGYPYETQASMLGTLDEARRIRAAVPLAHPAVWPYQPIPGTPMYTQAVELGFEPPSDLLEWGNFCEYHLEEPWPGSIPDPVQRRRRLFQHFSTVARGLARTKDGWWERRARHRIATGDYGLGRVEAKAFDWYRRVTRARGPHEAPHSTPAQLEREPARVRRQGVR